MANYTVIQGDTTPILKITVSGYPDISDANWTGRAILSATIGATPVIDRALVKDSNNSGFLCYLTPAETAGLSIGTYALAYEVTNTTIVPPINREFQHNLIIKIGN